MTMPHPMGLGQSVILGHVQPVHHPSQKHGRDKSNAPAVFTHVNNKSRLLDQVHFFIIFLIIFSQIPQIHVF